MLRKQGEFTPDEYAKMKEHPAIGARIVREVLTGVESPDFVQVATNVAHYHHEKVDGTENFTLTFAEIEQITGFPIDHSFLNAKNELQKYGYQVGKISMKKQTVQFQRRTQ